MENKYIDDFIADKTKQAILKKPLADAMTLYGLEVPSTKDGYRKLVESLNIKEKTGCGVFVALMKLSKAAAEYYESMEATKRKINRLTIDQRNKLIVIMIYQLVSSLLEPKTPDEYAAAHKCLFNHESPELWQLAGINDLDPAELKNGLIAYLRENGLSCEVVKH